MPTNGGKKLRFIYQNVIKWVVFVSSSVRRCKIIKKLRILQKIREKNDKFAHSGLFLYLCSAFPWWGCVILLLDKNMSPENKKLLKVIITVLIAALSALAAALGLQSCNVTRTITNESQYFQRGDTSVMIQTKTVETYDATKKGR